MRSAILAASLFATPITTSAADLILTLQDTPAAPVQYQDGAPGAQSVQAHSAVAILIRHSRFDESARPGIRVGVENRSPGPVNLTPANVVVTTQTGQVLQLLTRDDAIAKAMHDARRHEGWTRFGAALQAGGGGYRTVNVETNGSVMTPGQLPTSYSGTSTARVYDPAAAASAQAAARARIEQAQAENARNIAQAAREGIAAQTIQPGSQYFTDLGLDKIPKNVTRLSITVSLAGDTHTFLIDVAGAARSR